MYENIFLLSFLIFQTLPDDDAMVHIHGGGFRMGTSAADGRDGESPVRSVTVKSFQLDKYPVTNSDFRYDCKT